MPQFRLNVLNPGGRDPEQHFADAGAIDPKAHAPVNFHAYAACTSGSFFCETKRAAAEGNPVLLLLRGDFRDSERALAALQRAGIPVAVSLKETGLHQIARQLEDAAKLARFLRLIKDADGCIAPTPEAADIYRAIRGDDEGIAYLPTPYPVHDARWTFSRPHEERRGIFVGTREWEVPSRNHAAALLAARQISDATDETVSVFNLEGRKGHRRLSTLGFPAGRLRVLERTRTYTEYLPIVAEHKIVLHLDSSSVPGQVAGDALLCRLPCVGGNGAIEREVFPELCGAGRSIGELMEIARNLLQDGVAYRTAIADSQRRALERLSFEYAATQLEEFFRGPKRPTLSSL